MGVSKAESESCPRCFTPLSNHLYCPRCGIQVAYPFWKKMGAWVFLLFIGYVMVRCHMKMLGGLQDL